MTSKSQVIVSCGATPPSMRDQGAKFLISCGKILVIESLKRKNRFCAEKLQNFPPKASNFLLACFLITIQSPSTPSSAHSQDSCRQILKNYIRKTRSHPMDSELITKSSKQMKKHIKKSSVNDWRRISRWACGHDIKVTSR